MAFFLMLLVGCNIFQINDGGDIFVVVVVVVVQVSSSGSSSSSSNIIRLVQVTKKIIIACDFMRRSGKEMERERERERDESG